WRRMWLTASLRSRRGQRSITKRSSRLISAPPFLRPRPFMWKARSTVAGDSRREPSRPLALARILVASAALIQIPATREHLARLLAPGTFRAPYVFSPSVGAAWGTGLVWLMVALAAAAMVGWHARIALGGLALAIAFLLALDQQLYRSDLYLLLLECGLLTLA